MGERTGGSPRRVTRVLTWAIWSNVPAEPRAGAEHSAHLAGRSDHVPNAPSRPPPCLKREFPSPAEVGRPPSCSRTPIPDAASQQRPPRCLESLKGTKPAPHFMDHFVPRVDVARRLLETARRHLLLIPYLWFEAQLCQNGGLRQATGAGGGGRGEVLLSPLGTLTALTRPPAAAFALRGTVLPAASSPRAAQGAESHPGGEKRRACPPAAKSASTPHEGKSLILCVPSGDREEAARTTGDTALSMSTCGCSGPASLPLASCILRPAPSSHPRGSDVASARPAAAPPPLHTGDPALPWIRGPRESTGASSLKRSRAGGSAGSGARRQPLSDRVPCFRTRSFASKSLSVKVASTNT